MGDNLKEMRRIVTDDTNPDATEVANYLMRTGADPELAMRVAKNISASPDAATSRAYIRQAKKGNESLDKPVNAWRTFLRPFQEYNQAGADAAGATTGPDPIKLVTSARTDPASGRPLAWDQPMMNRNNLDEQRRALMANQTAGQLVQGYGLPPDAAIKLASQINGYQSPPTVPAVQ